MSPLLRSGLATNQEKICSHSPSKGSLWVRRQPRTRFLRSCPRYKVWSPAVGSGGALPEEKRFRHRAFYGKDGEEGKRNGRHHRRATDSAGERDLLQLLSVAQQADGA